MKNKKAIVFVSSIIILLLIIVTSVLFLIKFLPNSNEAAIKKLSLSLEVEGHKNIPIFTKSYNANLEKLKNPKLSEKDRYQAVENEINILFNAYGVSNDPEIKKYITSLAPTAKKAFPHEYKEETFKIPCSDPKCGDKIDSEMNNLIKEIDNLPVDKTETELIILNLKNGTYKPKDDPDRKFGKYISYQLAFNQLNRLNNPLASQSANKLKAYVKNRFNLDIYEPK